MIPVHPAADVHHARPVAAQHHHRRTANNDKQVQHRKSTSSTAHPAAGCSSPPWPDQKPWPPSPGWHAPPAPSRQYEKLGWGTRTAAITRSHWQLSMAHYSSAMPCCAPAAPLLPHPCCYSRAAPALKEASHPAGQSHHLARPVSDRRDAVQRLVDARPVVGAKFAHLAAKRQPEHGVLSVLAGSLVRKEVRDSGPQLVQRLRQQWLPLSCFPQLSANRH